MFQAGSRHGEFQRLLVAAKGLQAVDQPAGKAVAATHPIHDVRDLVMTAGQELLAVMQARRPAVMRRALRLAQRDRNHFEI